MQTWNLLKGRSAYVTRLKGVPSAVQWYDDGNKYADSHCNLDLDLDGHLNTNHSDRSR